VILRPGNSLIAGCLLLVVLGSLAFTTSFAIYALARVAIVLGCAAAIDAFLVARDIKRFSPRRILPGIAARGRTFPVTLDLGYQGRFMYGATIRDEIPLSAEPKVLLLHRRILPGQPNLEIYHLVIEERGRHRFGEVHIRITGRMGLMEAQKSWAINDSIRVLPESLVPSDELKKDSLDEQRILDQIRESQKRGEGTEFESLSEFREGDDVRRIHWRSTARSKRLIVSRFQVEQHREVMVLLDCGRLMGTAVGNGTKLDCAVNAALVISRVALRSGDRCGMAVFDSKVRGYLAPVAGAASHFMFVDRLYDTKPGWVETNFIPMFATLEARQRKRALIIVLSDISDADTTEKFRAALASLRKRHEVMFVALRTPHLEASAHATIRNVQDVARNTAAIHLLRERDQTLHLVNRSGVQVLNVEPRQVTVPLINAFIDIKRRNVI